MIVAVRRTFTVAVPRARAWQKLAEVDGWPEWAPHITAAELSPGPLGPTSTGWLKLRGLGRNSFRMTAWNPPDEWTWQGSVARTRVRSEEHTSELQSQSNLVCRLLLEKKNAGEEAHYASAIN